MRRRVSKDPAFTGFEQILRSVYNFGGKIKGYNDHGDFVFEIAVGNLAIAHTKGLITIDNQSRKIELTSKGVYFAGRYPAWGR